MEASISPGLYYKHSGRFSISGVAVAVGFGLLVGLPCAWLYARLIHLNPFVYVNLLAALLFGTLIGIAVESRLKAHKCRNTTVAAFAGLLVVLISYYVSWAVWLNIFAQTGILQLLKHPVDMWQWALAVNESGTWSVQSSTRVNGGSLWIVWGFEAACIIGFAVYTAAHGMQEATYCESCDQFAKLTKGVCSVGAGTAPSTRQKAALKSYLRGLKAHAAELKLHLEAKDLFYVEQLGGRLPDAVAWYQFDMASCPQCNITNTLSVEQHQRRVVRKQSKTSHRPVLRNLLLSTMEADSIRKLREKFQSSAVSSVSQTSTQGQGEAAAGTKK
jgi:hypothetical protein